MAMSQQTTDKLFIFIWNVWIDFPFYFMNFKQIYLNIERKKSCDREANWHVSLSYFLPAVVKMTNDFLFVEIIFIISDLH